MIDLVLLIVLILTIVIIGCIFYKEYKIYQEEKYNILIILMTVDVIAIGLAIAIVFI